MCLSLQNKLEAVKLIEALIPFWVVSMSVVLRVVIEATRVCAQRPGNRFTSGEKTSRDIVNEIIECDRLFIILLTAGHSS